MTIKNVTRVILDREIKRARGEDTQKGSKSGDVKSSVSKFIDTANISSKAIEVHANQASQPARIAAIGILDKATSIDEVISRIQEGYYERPEVIDEIASSIIKSENLGRAEEQSNHINDISRKIDRGFYDGKDVIETIATKLLDFLK